MHDPYLDFSEEGFGDEGGTPPGRARRDAPESDYQQVHIRIRSSDYAELSRRARQSGLQPSDLINSWVEEQLQPSPKRSDVHDDLQALASLLRDERQGVDRAVARLARLEGVATEERLGIDRAVSRIARLETVATHLIARLDNVEKAVVLPSEHRARQLRPSSPSQPVRLHDEIVDILREHGPIKVSEIARLVAVRGNYTPRGSSTVTPSAISARVTHARYRSRFIRQDDRVALNDR